MSSEKPATDWFDIDLERDMPLTAADLEAMERSRRLRPLTADDYQRWVDLITAGQPPRDPRLNTDSDEPFNSSDEVAPVDALLREGFPVTQEVVKGDEAAAYDFVDAWLSPETGKYLIEASGYGHANIKSFELANKADVAAMGITDPVEHMKSAILFPPLTGSSLAAQIKLWEEVKALKQ